MSSILSKPQRRVAKRDQKLTRSHVGGAMTLDDQPPSSTMAPKIVAPEKSSLDLCAKYCEERVNKRFGLTLSDVQVITGKGKDALKKARAKGILPPSGSTKGEYDYTSIFYYWSNS